MEKIDKAIAKRVKLWYPQQEKILKTWGEASACYRYMNYRAFNKFKKLSMRFTLPVIVLSTITGTANFAQEQFPASIRPIVPSIIGGMNLIAGLIATIMQFLKINELMESHRVASMQYGKLSRTIRLELTLPLDERAMDGRDMIEQCRAEYDRLIEQSPPVPSDILIDFEKEFGKSNIFKPEIMHIQPIDPYQAITENIKRVTNTLKKDVPSVVSKVISEPQIYVSPKQTLYDELENLKNSGIVSIQSDVMKELKDKTELMEKELKEVKVVSQKED
uniref:SMODS and SLOG-associating 2TM effector domain-containing protein n=1 Tax=viral metagenome TaxID=1070528 RepID=A0A6C0JX54_9ZZZZ